MAMGNYLGKIEKDKAAAKRDEIMQQNLASRQQQQTQGAINEGFQGALAHSQQKMNRKQEQQTDQLVEAVLHEQTGLNEDVAQEQLESAVRSGQFMDGLLDDLNTNQASLDYLRTATTINQRDLANQLPIVEGLKLNSPAQTALSSAELGELMWRNPANALQAGIDRGFQNVTDFITEFGLLWADLFGGRFGKEHSARRIFVADSEVKRQQFNSIWHRTSPSNIFSGDSATRFDSTISGLAHAGEVIGETGATIYLGPEALAGPVLAKSALRFSAATGARGLPGQELSIGSLSRSGSTRGFKPSSKSGLAFEPIEITGTNVKEISLFTRQKFVDGQIVNSKFEQGFIYGSFDEATGQLFIRRMGVNQANRGHHVGQEMISNIIESIGPSKVKSLKGSFAQTNKEVFDYWRAQGLSPVEAAKLTPGGKARINLGFENLVVKEAYPYPIITGTIK